jgi:hypothetical protein
MYCVIEEIYNFTIYYFFTHKGYDHFVWFIYLAI